MANLKPLFPLFPLFCLLVAGGCSRTARFERLDKELGESLDRLGKLSNRVLNYYAAYPDDEGIGFWFEECCYDDTFDRMDSLVMQQRDLLYRMADCCPRKLRRRLVFRVGQYCDIRRLVDVAEFPFIYKEFGPRLRNENPPFITED